MSNRQDVRLFVMGLEPTEDEWSLDDPVPNVDSEAFRRGERIEAPGDLRIPIAEPGRPLDITARADIVVVAEWVASLIESLTPDDVQRIPVRIDGLAERYELLHVLARIDCIDRDHTLAYARRPGATTGQSGTLASLAPLIEGGNLYRHVMRSDMTLRTDKIDGARIFRVPGWELWPVVTSKIKTALEQRGVTGVCLDPLRTTP